MKKLFALSSFCLLLFAAGKSEAQNPKLTLDLTKAGANVSPRLYGLMTEEINHSYDGGLYAELIRNRIFKDNASTPEAWSVIQEGGAKASIQLVAAKPDNVPIEQRRHVFAEVLDDDLDLLGDVVRVQPHPAHDALHGGAAFDGLLVVVHAVVRQLERQPVRRVVLEHVEDEPLLDRLAH